MTKWTTAKIVFLFWFVMQVKTQNRKILPFLARGVPLCNVHSPVGRRGLFNHFVDIDICCSRYSRSFGCYPIPAEIDQGLIGNWHFELSVFVQSRPAIINNISRKTLELEAFLGLPLYIFYVGRVRNKLKKKEFNLTPSNSRIDRLYQF